MSGILHIPLSVLDAAESDADMRRLVWLFRRASWKKQVFPWRQKSGAVRQIPLSKGEVFATLRYLSEVWGEGVGAIRGFLERMSAAGVAEVVTRAGVTVIRLLTLADAQGKAKDDRTDRSRSAAHPSACDESEKTGTGTHPEASAQHKINLVNKSNIPPTPRAGSPCRASRASRGARGHDGTAGKGRSARDSAPYSAASASPAPKGHEGQKRSQRALIAGCGDPASKPWAGILRNTSNGPARPDRSGQGWPERLPRDRAGLAADVIEDAKGRADPAEWAKLIEQAKGEGFTGPGVESEAARKWRGLAIMRGEL